MTALVLAIHNFPEGMVTFLTGLEISPLATPCSHRYRYPQYPRGISVSVPIYMPLGVRRRPFGSPLPLGWQSH